MLSQERRISKSLFGLLIKEGKNYHTDFLFLKTSPKPGGGKSAFSVVVSAKTASRAVERNFLKRRGRHVIKKHLEKIKDGYLCAIFLKPAISPLPFDRFEAEIINGLKRAGLVR